MKRALLILFSIILFSCIKDEKKDWYCQCKGYAYDNPDIREDSILFLGKPWIEYDKDWRDIISVENDRNDDSGKWTKVYGIHDSVWLEYKCICRPYVCAK